MNGAEVADPPRYLIGVAEMPLADPYDPSFLERKLDAGADVVWTQIAYDVDGALGVGRRRAIAWRLRARRRCSWASCRCAPRRARASWTSSCPACGCRHRSSTTLEAAGDGRRRGRARPHGRDRARHPSHRRHRRRAPDGHGPRRRRSRRGGAGGTLPPAHRRRCSGARETPRMPASLVIRNARVYTVDPDRPWTSAVAIEGDRIAWVGDDADAARAHRSRHRGDRRRRGDGAARIHRLAQPRASRLEPPRGRSRRRRRRSMRCRARIRAHADAHPEHTMDRGRRLQLLRHARRAHADVARPRRAHAAGDPRSCLTYDAHNAWLNREAMEAFGITGDTDALAWGHVRKDPDTRRADGRRGRLRGHGHQPRRTSGARGGAARLRARAAVRANAREPRHGDGVRHHDDRGAAELARRHVDLRARARRGQAPLPARSRRCSTRWAPPMRSATSSRPMRERFDDDRLRVGPIKLYIDDVIEPWTAAMLEPYANRPGERGETFWQPDEFAEAGDRAGAARVVVPCARHRRPRAARRARRVRGGTTRERCHRMLGTAWCTRSACTPTTCLGSARSA